mmetsp:Transcript_30606/g.79401  ORF Transcript_30606/g.79401 Transcript_30606/m.79401 type:complete len:200 (-) Transcript_30606:272-871(-)
MPPPPGHGRPLPLPAHRAPGAGEAEIPVPVHRHRHRHRPPAVPGDGGGAVLLRGLGCHRGEAQAARGSACAVLRGGAGGGPGGGGAAPARGGEGGAGAAGAGVLPGGGEERVLVGAVPGPSLRSHGHLGRRIFCRERGYEEEREGDQLGHDGDGVHHQGGACHVLGDVLFATGGGGRGRLPGGPGPGHPGREPPARADA